MAVTVLNTVCFGGVAPRKLVVGEGFTDPLGFHDATPSFSWQLPEGAERQTAYQVEVRDQDLVWDSGWVESDQSQLVPYAGKPLASRQRLEWRVRFRDEVGVESDWSEYATFELGLLSNSDWTAQWIHAMDAPVPRDFQLVEAIYRSKESPDRSRDVTELLQGKIKNNVLSVHVTNEALGGDPAYLEVKELVVTYELNGEVITDVLEEKKKGTFPPSSGGSEQVATLRRQFQVPWDIERARLYVTARGVFDVAINGERVGEDYFANGWTSYKHRIDTLTYDVTDLLRGSSDNTIDVLLGTGWYAGRIGWKHQKHLFGRHPELLFQLEVFNEEGECETIISDGQWMASFDGPIVSSSIYDGEYYDARRKATEWGPVMDSSELGDARLVPKPFAPVRKTETLSTRSVTEPEPGRYVFDLGQNLVGWAKLRIPVEKDQTVTIRFAEMLNTNGTLYTANYRSAKSTDYYTAAKTGTIEWEPTFTFHGFRYVELSGLPEGVKPQNGWVTGVVLHSDLPQIGGFASSHAKLNQLFSNIIWGQRGNFLDIPTDCPQRDERLGWTGDAQVFAPAAMFNYDCHAFWKSWLGSMRDDQVADGRIPHVIPSVVGAGSPGWQDAGTIIPWVAYVRTGDKELLADNFVMMEKLVGWYRSQAKDNRILKIQAFGDWLQPYAAKNKGDTPAELIGTAFYANSAQILADSARVLGRKEETAKYGAEATAVKQAFAAHYFDADGKLKNTPETQTAYLLAIAFDLITPDLVDKAVPHLVRLVDEAEGHLRTGFLGTPFILSVLDAQGHSDLAYSILFKETYPSWFFSINQGATTMWERWNSYSHADGFGNAGMNSFNHYAYGAVGQWMVERIAGLAPDPAHPGYKHFFIQPVVGGPLDWARADLETPYGKAYSGWKKLADGRLEMKVVVPPNTTATVVFPDGRKPETVTAGSHRFKVKL